ncbi:hypothetical protein ACP275_10G179800 [Erythranthe tilingii]
MVCTRKLFCHVNRLLKLISVPIHVFLRNILNLKLFHEKWFLPCKKLYLCLRELKLKTSIGFMKVFKSNKSNYSVFQTLKEKHINQLHRRKLLRSFKYYHPTHYTTTLTIKCS